MRFPVLETRDLEGRRRTVPEDLDQGARIVILAFQRWHTALMDSWLPALRSLQQQYDWVSVWEVPALSRVYLPGRFFIDSGMSAGTPDPDARRHTLTAYTDLGALAAHLGFSGYDTIQLFLVDDVGEIVWRSQGQATEQSVNALFDALGALDNTA